MPPALSAVFVSFRSAARTRDAIESFRADAARAGLACEALAVVNSGDETEAAALDSVADEVLRPPRNLGYAGGLNRGVDRARGEVLFLANPDLVFRPGSVEALARAASAPRLAAGPAFFLDGGETLLLPPFEEPTPCELVRRRLTLDPTRRELPFRREVRRLRAHAASVDAGSTRAATSLSGALLAVSRRTFDLVGPFDEGYRLYYEENDWERRLRRLGGSLALVGAARVVHFFNQSAAQEPRSAAWFAASERRYFASHFGARGLSALERLHAETPPAPAAAPLPDGRLPLAAPVSARVGVAFSPVPTFRPFLLARPDREATSWAPPADVLANLGGALWWARAFDLDSGAIYAEGAVSSKATP